MINLGAVKTKIDHNNSAALSGTRYVNKEQEEIQVKLSEIDEYLSSGWKLGRSSKFKEQLRKFQNENVLTHSEETKQKMRNQSKGKIYFTQPDLMQLVAVRNLNDAPIGWIKGNKLKQRNEKIALDSKLNPRRKSKI